MPPGTRQGHPAERKGCDTASVKGRFCPFLLEPIPKNGVWFKVEEEAKRQPEEYMKYFEDWLFASDKEIGP
jgi:hypothetical protein